MKIISGGNEKRVGDTEMLVNKPFGKGVLGTKKRPMSNHWSLVNSADDRNRTCTSGTLDPKSSASASSATPAWLNNRSVFYHLRGQMSINFY